MSLKPLLFASLVAIPLFLSLGGCRREGNEAAEETPEPTPDPTPRDELGLTADEKQWWIEKAARTLHKGQGLTDEAEIQRLAQLPYADITTELMKNPRFYDVAIDFNLYYFGIKSDRLTFPNEDDVTSFFFNVMSIAQAVEGAMRLKENGDYLGMLNEDARIYASPFAPVFDFQTGKIVEDSKKVRQEAYAQIGKSIDELIGMVDADPSPIPDFLFCDYLFSMVRLDTFTLNIPEQFSDAMRSFPELEELTKHCFAKRPPPGTTDLLRSAKVRFEKLTDYMLQFESDVYWPQSMVDLKELDFKAMGVAEQRPGVAMQWFWRFLTNSSTNYNRKRAAYVLKRFFCDDLTPVNVVLPKDHAGGKHGSDPGCQACHYKLDPMAGFFRTRGSNGFDYAKQQGDGPKMIFFDDGASKNLDEYATSWRASEASGRAWDVGYVRSSTDPKLTSYGAHPEDPTVADLFALIREAPEARQCLVRRMFEYFVGQDQVVDSGYIEHLAAQFSTKAKETNSADAFRQTVLALVTSKAFRVKDAVSEQCYDRAPEDTAPEAERPPCRVAFVLEKNCVGCHKGEGASGGLDLSRWAKLADGKSGFAHKSQDGQPVDRFESLKRVHDRLVSADPELRMPLNKEMPVSDRDALFLWISKTLDEAGK